MVQRFKIEFRNNPLPVDSFFLLKSHRCSEQGKKKVGYSQTKSNSWRTPIIPPTQKPCCWCFVGICSDKRLLTGGWVGFGGREFLDYLTNPFSWAIQDTLDVLPKHFFFLQKKKSANKSWMKRNQNLRKQEKMDNLNT